MIILLSVYRFHDEDIYSSVRSKRSSKKAINDIFSVVSFCLNYWRSFVNWDSRLTRRISANFRAVERSIHHFFDLSLWGDQFVSTTFQVCLWHVDRAVQVAIIYLLFLCPLVVSIETLFTDWEWWYRLILSYKIWRQTHLVVKGCRGRNASRYIRRQKCQPIASQSVCSISWITRVLSLIKFLSYFFI